MQRSALKGLLALLPTAVLALGFVASSSQAAVSDADAEPKPGTYCPRQGSVFLILEELTVALHSVAQAKENLLVLDDSQTANVLLGRAGTGLALAASRGSGARVATFIDTAMAAKKDGDPKAMLLWFPTLKRALSGLPAGTTREAAKTQIAAAEAIVHGQAAGDEIRTLLQARQLLVCDPLDIPMQQSLAHLSRLHRNILQGKSPSADDFNALIGLLNRAMDYGLQRLVKLERP